MSTNSLIGGKPAGILEKPPTKFSMTFYVLLVLGLSFAFTLTAAYLIASYVNKNQYGTMTDIEQIIESIVEKRISQYFERKQESFDQPQDDNTNRQKRAANDYRVHPNGKTLN
jgi:hypothetical protein